MHRSILVLIFHSKHLHRVEVAIVPVNVVVHRMLPRRPVAVPFLASRMASSHAEGHPSLPEADRLVSGQLLLKLVRDVDLLVHLH